MGLISVSGNGFSSEMQARLMEIHGSNHGKGAPLRLHGQWVAEVMVALLPPALSHLKGQVKQAKSVLCQGDAASLGKAMDGVSPALRHQLKAHLPQIYTSLMSVSTESSPAIFRQDFLRVLSDLKNQDPSLAQSAYLALSVLKLPKALSAEVTRRLGHFSGTGSVGELAQHYTTVVSHELRAHPEAVFSFAAGGLAFQGARYWAAFKLRHASSLTRLVGSSLAGLAAETPAMNLTSAGLSLARGQIMGPMAWVPTYLNMASFHLGTGAVGLGLRSILGRGAKMAMRTSQRVFVASATKLGALGSLHLGHQLTTSLGYYMPDTSFAGSLAHFVQLELTGSFLHLSHTYSRAQRHFALEGTRAIRDAAGALNQSAKNVFHKIPPASPKAVAAVGLGREVMFSPRPTHQKALDTIAMMAADGRKVTGRARAIVPPDSAERRVAVDRLHGESSPAEILAALGLSDRDKIVFNENHLGQIGKALRIDDARSLGHVRVGDRLGVFPLGLLFDPPAIHQRLDGYASAYILEALQQVFFSGKRISKIIVSPRGDKSQMVGFLLSALEGLPVEVLWRDPKFQFGPKEYSDVVWAWRDEVAQAKLPSVI